MLRRLAVLAVALVLSSAAPLPAQNAAMTAQLYGTGVHAYFSGDYNRAFELFNAAATSGVADPRVVYFRGLAQLRLGRTDEAKQDFQKASKLEIADQERMYNVSRALERIQGGDRLLIEQYRGEARIVAFQKAEEMRKTRYEEQRATDDRVLQKPVAPGFGELPTPGAKVSPVPPTGAVPTSPAVPTPPAVPPTPIPAKTDVAPPADTSKAAPTTPAKPALDANPFSPDGPKAAVADDPFAPPKPAPTEATAGKPKPGTTAAPAVSAKKPAETKTTTKPAAGAEEDPFAETTTPAKPAPKTGKAAAPGKTAPKPVEEEDPFADSAAPAKPAKAAAKPAKQPAVDVPSPDQDPFAN